MGRDPINLVRGSGPPAPTASPPLPPDSVTGEPSALSPKCDMHQDKSTERLSETAYKIEGDNCLQNVGHILLDTGEEHLVIGKILLWGA